MEKRIKLSRWAGPETRRNYGSIKFPSRYADSQSAALGRYTERYGWSKGARIRKG